MSTSHTTILKVSGIQEWIAETDGEYHLTADRELARPFKKSEVSEVIKQAEGKFKVKVTGEAWIIAQARYINQNATAAYWKVTGHGPITWIDKTRNR